MGFNREFVHVYTVRCDGCRKESRPAFHRIVAVSNAKRQRYERFEVQNEDNKKEILWFCAACLRKPKVREHLEPLGKVTSLPVRTAVASS